MKPASHSRLRCGRRVGAAVALLLTAASPSHAQLRVLISGGFAAAYRQVLPDFERGAGVTVTTMSGSSQGTGPETISAQLARGVLADVVILSREGLKELTGAGRIVPGTDVDLAQTPLGLAIRAGAPKPDISTVERFKQALLAAKTLATPGSTSGIYLTKELLPRLGLADKITVTVTARGSETTALVAAGSAAAAILPVSELLHVAGLDFVGAIPAEIQLVQVFAGAVVVGSKEAPMAKRLIAFLASDRTTAAIIANGMAPPRGR